MKLSEKYDFSLLNEKLTKLKKVLPLLNKRYVYNDEKYYRFVVSNETEILNLNLFITLISTSRYFLPYLISGSR